MNKKKNVNDVEEVKNENLREAAVELSTLVTGWLIAIMGFLAALNVEFQWLTNESVGALGVVIVATIMLVGGVYTVYKNTFVITKRAREQKEELKKRGLK